MSTKIKVPEGWGVKNYSVKLKPGKPKDAASWVDVQGRPVVKNGRTWSLQKQSASAPRELTPQEIQQKRGGQKAQAPQPETNSKGEQNPKPEELEYYKQFSSIAKEKIEDGTRESFYPDPEQAKQDEDNRKRAFAPYMALSDDQLSAVGAYTSEWDLNMNSFLRSGKIDHSAKQRLYPEHHPVPSEAQIKKAIDDLTSTLEQLPKAPQGSFLRAVSGDSDFIKQLHTLEEGDTIEDSGFSSFTSGGAPVVDRFFKGEANSDQNILFEVESDQMTNISPISRYQNEKEHMLAPGAKFKVVSKQIGFSRRAGEHLVIKLQHITT